MYPRITRDGIDIPYGESFSGIWNELENISHTSDGKFAVEMIGRFIVAAAYMVSHEEIEPGIWRLSESDSMKKFYDDLERRVRTTTHIQGNIPIRVFLNMVEAIALQEDVKYFTLNGNKYAGNKGRVNNLLTTAGVIRFLSGNAHISWLVGSLSRNPPGVVSMTQDQIREYFKPIP